MNYNLIASILFLAIGVLFFLLGNTLLGAVFVAVGAVFLAIPKKS